MTAAPVSGRARALGLIALGQLLVLSLWFSASAVSPQLNSEWRLSSSAETGLTLFVQIGFVAGALLISATSIADAIPSRRLFVGSAVVASLVNLGLLVVDVGTVEIGLGLRFLTGMLIAGVYPSGLKVMSGWFRSGRGMALGVLVGALTVGSATPHLVRGIGLEWRGVVISSSVLALAGALLMTKVGDGPFEVPRQPFRWGQASQVVRSRGVRLATFGYLGHMWELYAMWTWMAAFLVSSAAEFGGSYGSIPILTFAVIAMGGLGSWFAGLAADRLGRTWVAGGAMAISGTCALATPLIFGRPAAIVIPVVLLWGVTVVADSAQFSTMVTEVASEEVRGTALTLQTALGFLLTLVTIRAVPLLADALTWRWAFPMLAIGPALGVVAMARLKRSPESVLLAAGRG
jgi:MFS family permease